MRADLARYHLRVHMQMPTPRAMPWSDDSLSGGRGGGGSRADLISEFVDTALNTSYEGEQVSDKVTSHSYETMYGTYLLPLRDRMSAKGQRLKMLEIGVGCDMQRGKPGASTTLWSKLLPTAERWMADLDGDCVRSLGKEGLRANVVQGDQADEQVVKRWVRETGGGFDVIIDDGAHGNHHIRNSLRVLWSALAPGGVYFVEDLHVSRSAPIETTEFTVADMLHAWSEQLISSRQTRAPKNTLPNRLAAEATKLYPKPPDLGFLFLQRDAAVLGKLSPAEAFAQHTHAQIPDVGSGPLTEHARNVVSRMATVYREEAQSSRRSGARRDGWCVLLTATTHIHVNLKKVAPSCCAKQQQNATERQEMYRHVLRRWAEREPDMPITLVENSGDDLIWAEHVRGEVRHPSIELIRLTPAKTCPGVEIGCFEADAILRGVKRSAVLDPRKSTSRCSHVLKVTARYVPTDNVSLALRTCNTLGTQMAVQTSGWGDASLHWSGTQMFGFRATLSEALFGWSQKGERCQECHVNGYVKELRQAVENKRIPADAVCQLPRLNVEPVRQGSNGILTNWLRLR